MLLQVSCLAYFLALKMEAIWSSEASHSLRTTGRYNPEDDSQSPLQEPQIQQQMFSVITEHDGFITVITKL
jgi:hypothetical protein